MTPSIPLNLVHHHHIDGSVIDVGHDGTQWVYSSRAGTLSLPTQYFGLVKFNEWSVICFFKNNADTIISIGTEDSTHPTPWTVPIVLKTVAGMVTRINAAFDFFVIFANSGNAICNFKFWNVALSGLNMQAQCQQWHANPTAGAAPFWVSPLRVPGDISNITNPYTGPGETWEHGHAYTNIDNPSGLQLVTDPAYMANTSQCQSWLYPSSSADCIVDPGTTPISPTFYDADPLIKFQDRGTLATEDFQIYDVVYYGSSTSGTDTGTPFNESWGLFIDDVGNRIAPTGDAQYRFVPGDTAVTIPPGVNGVPKASTIYLWQFGARFLWNPITPQGPTKTAIHNKLYLYVTYQGYPTGKPTTPPQDLTGLFTITAGASGTDIYNRNLAVKIPDPTIRTAYIGE
jgi:hypothetical protein